MGAQPIGRTEHLVPGTDDVWRTDALEHEELGTDVVEHLRPLEAAHTTALHGVGVAAGLAVEATAGTTTVRVRPGVAVDSSGRHVVLTAGGWAHVSAAGSSGQLTPVTDDGVEVPLTGSSGTCLLTIQWRETFDQDLHDSTGRFRTRHTPWLRLLPPAPVPEPEPDPDDDPKDRVLLTRVTIAADGQVAPDGLDGHGRTALSLTTGGLVLRATGKQPSPDGSSVGEAEGGDIRSRSGGGLELGVPGTADPALTVTASGDLGVGTALPRARLDVAGAAAVAGPLQVDGWASVGSSLTVGDAASVGSSLEVAASASVGSRLQVGASASVGSSLEVSASATVGSSLQVGASTSVGTWLNVTDSASVGSWLVVGGGAWVGSTLSLGTGQQSGSLFVRGPGEVPRVLAWADGDAGVATIRRPDGQDSIFLEGRTGFVYSRSGGDWRIVGGNPARSVHSVWLFAGSGGTDVAQVDLGSTRQVFACVAMTGSDPLDPVDRLDAFAVDVFLVDGNPTASFVHGGDHWGAQGAVENVRAQSWWGRARTIQFRARSRQNASVMGLGLVFFE